MTKGDVPNEHLPEGPFARTLFKVGPPFSPFGRYNILFIYLISFFTTEAILYDYFSLFRWNMSPWRAGNAFLVSFGIARAWHTVGPQRPSYEGVGRCLNSRSRAELVLMIMTGTEITEWNFCSFVYTLFPTPHHCVALSLPSAWLKTREGGVAQKREHILQGPHGIQEEVWGWALGGFLEAERWR